MKETTAAILKMYEDSLLEAESKVEFYRLLLGKPLMKSNATYTKEIESLKSQLQEKNEELKSLKSSYDFSQWSLSQLRDKLEKCPVSGEATIKLKGIYHTFFKARISHPDYLKDDTKDCSNNPQVSTKDGTSDEKEPAPEVTIGGFQIYYKSPATGQIIKGRLLTKYEALELKYNAQREENKRLLRRVAAQKSENEILQGKVNDLDHKLSQACQERDKLSQACQERDKLAEKLRRAEVEAQKYDLLLKKLNHLIYEETRY